MNLILAGLLASVLAFITNRYLVFKFGNWPILYLIPTLEEIIKTGLYYLLNANLIIVHLIFGIVEAGFDYLNSSLAAILAIISHLLFAYSTLIIWRLTNSLVVAVIITALIHTGWNFIIGRIVV